MKRAIFVLISLLFICLSCGILSPDSLLTGKWKCSLFTMNGPSDGIMQLKENNGKIKGNFVWQDLNLSVTGTVNTKRQVNMEAQDSVHRCIFALKTINDDFLEGSFSYYKYFPQAQASVFIDGGSIELHR